MYIFETAYKNKLSRGLSLGFFFSEQDTEMCPFIHCGFTLILKCL